MRFIAALAFLLAPSVAWTQQPVTIQAGNQCPTKYHFESGQQGAACVPDCPDGYRASAAAKDRCLPHDANGDCITVAPLRPSMAPSLGGRKDWGWRADLCDAKTVVASHVDPVYPEIAQKAHVQGLVALVVIGDERGAITYTGIVGGHPMLVPAANSALAQWHWKPPLLASKPIEFRTTIYFAFELTQQGPRVRTFFSEHDPSWPSYPIPGVPRR